MLKKKSGPIFKELKNLPKKLSLPVSSHKYVFGIRDPRSGIRKNPRVKKAPDPGSGSATLCLKTVN